MKKRLASIAAGVLIAAAALVGTGTASFAGSDWDDFSSNNTGTHQTDGSNWHRAPVGHQVNNVFGSDWD
jgi:hypothetical protein